ncbi:MAG: FliH/SctL family protein [Lachnospiraceae bacterium]
MRSLPNLVKQRFVVENKEQTRLINSNEKMEQLIGLAGKEGFTPGLYAQQVDVVSDEKEQQEGLHGVEALLKDQDDPGEEETDFGDSFPGESDIDFSEQSHEQADEILQQARMQADQILEEARSDAAREAEDMKQQAYQQGVIQAQEELDRLKQCQQEEYQEMLQEQKGEYRQRLEQLEPDLVESILSVVEDILHVDIQDYAPIILDLVMQTVMQVESPKEMTIMASEENCVYIKEHSDQLRTMIGEKTKLEILANQMLSVQECRIETEYGIYDCGFDVQLKNLGNRMRLLSRQKE